ncbi:sensor histidine kinase YycG [bacterium BMS3Abin09]|nr:sensor histidine kinase YycG [bacterium BMS3Abin09]GBE41844.1 sensor histidine kinase YycG [bacterium BMS3Bbin09]HDH33966.1 HAMP domain-containing protein [Nitrospirota bacterium]
MKNLKALLGLFILSFIAFIITGVVLNYLGIEHGSLLTKIGFVFITVNIILYLLLLIFFIFRYLVNLYTEKKRKAIGSKFRTKLVASFLGLVLIPSALLFLLSNELINNSIDTWFTLEVQKPIYDSMDIAKTMYYKERQYAENYAELLASSKDLLNRNLQNSQVTDDFRSYLLNETDGSDLVDLAFKGTSGTDILSSDQGDIIRAAKPFTEDGKITGVVIVETLIPMEIVTKMESIQDSFHEYIQMKVQQNPVRFLYFLILVIATLLVIFMALWVSIRIAKGITVPIQSLAEATETVAHGNLNFRIALKRDDEIGLLINSFNKMLDDLQDGKQSLEMAYRESDRRRLGMETILESIKSGVIFFDRSGKIMTLNNAACSMLNVKRGSIEGKGHKDLMSTLQSSELGSMVKRLIEKGFGSVEKELHIYIHGRPMDLRVYITIIKDSEEKLVGTLAVFDNLTEIIMAQRALAWQEVAKRIAHEIKNPLTPIRLSAERLLKKWNDKADDFGSVLNRSTKTIVHEVNSLRSLVDEFSRFGKMPKINLEPINIKMIIEEVTELYSDLKEIEMISSINEEMPDIEVDKKQIKMALINLIDNAIQAKTEKIWLSAFHNIDFDLIRIEIADDGAGIKEEDKDKLFFPYFSTKKEGTGLGLAIVNSIISKHRGYIRVQDNEPRGTRFIIELPMAQK